LPSTSGRPLAPVGRFGGHVAKNLAGRSAFVAVRGRALVADCRLVESRRVRGRALPEPRHESVERVGVHGLHEMVVEAGRHRLLLVLLPPIAGEGNEHDLLEVRVPSHSARHLIAVDPRKPDVHQHHIGDVGARCIQGGHAVVGCAHAMAQQFEEHRETLRRIGVVLDHEHPRSSPRDRLGGRGWSRLLHHRQRHDELRALSEPRALGLDARTVQLDDPPRHREPDPETALCAVERPVRLREQVPHPG
jgi:hypothetical protein